MAGRRPAIRLQKAQDESEDSRGLAGWRNPASRQSRKDSPVLRLFLWRIMPPWQHNWCVPNSRVPSVQSQLQGYAEYPPRFSSALTCSRFWPCRPFASCAVGKGMYQVTVSSKPAFRCLSSPMADAGCQGAEITFASHSKHDARQKAHEGKILTIPDQASTSFARDALTSSACQLDRDRRPYLYGRFVAYAKNRRRVGERQTRRRNVS